MKGKKYFKGFYGIKKKKKKKEAIDFSYKLASYTLDECA